jgi:hypothetical protein
MKEIGKFGLQFIIRGGGCWHSVVELGSKIPEMQQEEDKPHATQIKLQCGQHVVLNPSSEL